MVSTSKRIQRRYVPPPTQPFEMENNCIQETVLLLGYTRTPSRLWNSTHRLVPPVSDSEAHNPGRPCTRPTGPAKPRTPAPCPACPPAACFPGRDYQSWGMTLATPSLAIIGLTQDRSSSLGCKQHPSFSGSAGPNPRVLKFLAKFKR